MVTCEQEETLLMGQHGDASIGTDELHLHDVRGNMRLELHAEVPDTLSVREAHERVTALEKAISREIPELKEVTAHIEPYGDNEMRDRAVQATSAEIEQAVSRLPQEVPGLQGCHHVSILRTGKEVSVSFHCSMDPDMPIGRAHELTSRTENRLREHFPGLGRVVIHVEPPDAG